MACVCWTPVSDGACFRLIDLEHGREIRDEVLRVVESTKEYSEYEKDVDFEMSMVRRRFVARPAVEPLACWRACDDVCGVLWCVGLRPQKSP